MNGNLASVNGNLQFLWE